MEPLEQLAGGPQIGLVEDRLPSGAAAPTEHVKLVGWRPGVDQHLFGQLVAARARHAPLARLHVEVHGRPGRVEPRWIGKNAGTILEEIGVRTGRDTRLAIADVPAEHSLVWTEQMMPVLPVVRTRTVDEAIDLAIQAEHGCGHTASIYSRDVNAITRMARDIDVSIFVANAANLAGLGDGGEGHTSFSIASPTGEGLTRPRSFSRERRMTVAGGLRIV